MKQQLDTLNDSRKSRVYAHLLGLTILIYFVVFVKLNSFHMRWWDESMFAVNTYEMMKNGKIFSLYFDSLPDLYNTKPPLTSWLQIPFVKLIGYNELALRLPSALAAALSILLLFKFVATHYSLLWAWISALILLTSSGFIGFHTARTADSDSLLTLFLLVANIHFIRYLLTEHKMHIFLFMLFITLAYAAKMYAAFLFFPAHLVILIRQKKLKSFIFNTTFVYSLSLFIILIIGLMWLRELDAPGYLKIAFFKDAGRVFTTIENHNEPAIFYLDNLFSSRYSVWFVFLTAGLLLSFFSEGKPQHELLVIFAILSLVYFAIITISITKLSWYDMPLYPYFSVISAYAIYFLIQKINFYPKVSRVKQLILILVFIFIYPYIKLFNKSQVNSIVSTEKVYEANEMYLFEMINRNKNLDGIKVFHSTYDRSLFFYKYKLAESGQHIELLKDDMFHLNDKVLVSEDSLKLLLSRQYKFTTIDEYGQASLLQLTEKIN